MGLRQRVILIITIPALLATAVHGISRVRQEWAQLLDEHQRSLTLTAHAIQIAVENALRNRQWSDLGRLVAAMVERQDVIDRIRLFDTKTAPVFVSNPLKIAEAIPSEALRRVLTSGASEALYQRRGGQSVISVVLPLRNATGAIHGAIEVAGLAGDMDRRLESAIVDVLVRLGLLLAVTTGLTALVLQRQVLAPLAHLADGIRRLGGGEAGVALAAARNDELGQLSRRFNDMAHRLQEARRNFLTERDRTLMLEEQARRAAALAVAGKLAAGLAHEVGTPLNIISARAEYILHRMPSGSAHRPDLREIVTQIDRISRTITGLLDVVRPQAPKLDRVALRRTLGDLWPLLDAAARQRGVQLVRSLDDGLPFVRADAGHVQQVLINLVINALEAMPDGGRVTVSARRSTLRGRDGVRVDVRDTGTGIAPELRPRIFHPFVTTKPRGQGTGLGLAISRDIARAHGGELDVESTPGAGSTFWLWLPVDETAC